MRSSGARAPCSGESYTAIVNVIRTTRKWPNYVVVAPKPTILRVVPPEFGHSAVPTPGRVSPPLSKNAMDVSRAIPMAANSSVNRLRPECVRETVIDKNVIFIRTSKCNQFSDLRTKRVKRISREHISKSPFETLCTSPYCVRRALYA